MLALVLHDRSGDGVLQGVRAGHERHGLRHSRHPARHAADAQRLAEFVAEVAAVPVQQVVLHAGPATLQGQDRALHLS